MTDTNNKPVKPSTTVDSKGAFVEQRHPAEPPQTEQDDHSKSNNPTGGKTNLPLEHGGAKGLEPTRYGDWEHNSRCTDF